MKKIGFMCLFMFVTLMTSAQGTKDLEMIRASFQEIQNEDDIQVILNFQIIDLEFEIANVIEAYQGASQCMIAKYVVAPWSKMKNFNAGKDRLEVSIGENKVVENVYLRLMIQLNAPKIVNYNKDIDSDLQFLEHHLVKTPMDLSFKQLMMENLLSAVKKKEQEEVLLKIDRSISN